MSPRWARGLWLGKRFTSEEHLIATADGLVALSGDVRDHPDIVWGSQLFDRVIGVPWDPLAKSRGEDSAEPRERNADLPRVIVSRGEDDPLPKARNVIRDRSYFDQFG